MSTATDFQLEELGVASAERQQRPCRPKIKAAVAGAVVGGFLFLIAVLGIVGALAHPAKIPVIRAQYVPRTTECIGLFVVRGPQKTMAVFAGLASLGTDEFAVCFGPGHLPLWTAHRIGTKPGDRARTRKFTNVFGLAYSHDDYKQVTGLDGGYDRGHLVPYADLAEAETTMDMVNVVPQLSACNQGSWKDFEADLRKNYQSRICVTLALQTWGGVRGRTFTAPAMTAPAGLCKIVLNDDSSVEYWGCIRHDAETCQERYDELSDDDMVPPGYSADGAPPA
jgi:hypothetical protein